MTTKKEKEIALNMMPRDLAQEELEAEGESIEDAEAAVYGED